MTAGNTCQDASIGNDKAPGADPSISRASGDDTGARGPSPAMSVVGMTTVSPAVHGDDVLCKRSSQRFPEPGSFVSSPRCPRQAAAQPLSLVLRRNGDLPDRGARLRCPDLCVDRLSFIPLFRPAERMPVEVTVSQPA